MFVDVELPVRLVPALVVPADAVVNSGVKTTVYVDKGDGGFEPRTVGTGWRIGDQVEIVKGLMAGERIVVSGTFLIDSESRMRAAAAGIHSETAECPVCGMAVDQAKAKVAGLTSEFRGTIYYFCAAEDKVAFDGAPTRYTAKTGRSPERDAGKPLTNVQWGNSKAERHTHEGHHGPAHPAANPTSGASHR
jgi:YHS domain-containing protein